MSFDVKGSPMNEDPSLVHVFDLSSELLAPGTPAVILQNAVSN